jgi:hypothetical protein
MLIINALPMIAFDIGSNKTLSTKKMKGAKYNVPHGSSGTLNSPMIRNKSAYIMLFAK